MRPLPLTPSLEPLPNSFPQPSPLSTTSSAISFAGRPPFSSEIGLDDDPSPLPTTLTLYSGRQISLLDPSPFQPLHAHQRYPRTHLDVLEAVVESSGGTRYQHLVPSSHLSLVASYLNVVEAGVKTWFRRPKKKERALVGTAGGDEGGEQKVEEVEIEPSVDEEVERKLKEREIQLRQWEKEKKSREAKEAQERKFKIKEAKKEEKKEIKRREKEVELKALKKKVFESKGKGWEIPELEIEFPEEWVFPEGVFLGGDVRKLEPLVVELGGRTGQGGMSSNGRQLDLFNIDQQQQHHLHLHQIVEIVEFEYLFNYPLDPFFSTFSSNDEDQLRQDACIHLFLPPPPLEPSSPDASLPPRPFSSSSKELDPITDSSEPASNSLLFSPAIPACLTLPLQPALLPSSTPQDPPDQHLPRTEESQKRLEGNDELDFLTAFTDPPLVEGPVASASSSSRLDLLTADEPASLGRERFTDGTGTTIGNDPISTASQPHSQPLPLTTHPALTPDESMNIFLAKLETLLAPQTQPLVVYNPQSEPQRLAFQPPPTLSSLSSSPVSLSLPATTWSKPISSEQTPLPLLPKPSKHREGRGNRKRAAAPASEQSRREGGKRVKLEEGIGIAGGTRGLKRVCSSSAEREGRLEEQGDLLGW